MKCEKCGSTHVIKGMGGCIDCLAHKYFVGKVDDYVFNHDDFSRKEKLYLDWVITSLNYNENKLGTSLSDYDTFRISLAEIRQINKIWDNIKSEVKNNG